MFAQQVSDLNNIIQTIILAVTVVVTWIIYTRKQRDQRKEVARKILVEYEKSIDVIQNAKKIVSEDLKNYDVVRLLDVSYINFDYWEKKGHILYRKLNDSEFKNIEIFFQKLNILFELLQTMKDTTKSQYEDYYQKVNGIKLKSFLDGDNETPKSLEAMTILQVILPREYTGSVLEECKDIDLLIKIFPKEKLKKIAK